MVTLIDEIDRLLEKRQPFVLATILSHSGSTPRSSGAKMLIRTDGRIAGTVGGGLLEARVINRAPEVFESRGTCIEHFALDADTADSMDMICGGSLSVLLEFVAGDRNNRRLFASLKKMVTGRLAGLAVTPIPDASERERPSEKILLGPDGPIAGHLRSASTDLFTLYASCRQLRIPSVVTHEQRTFYVEPMTQRESLFLFGAGHVSQSVSRIAHTVGFRIVVVDDRPEFANRQRFNEADDILIPDNFEHSVQAMTIDRNSYVVIVTRGHLHDRSVLAQVLRTEAGYIGMIGSKRKRDAIYTALLNDGYAPSEFKRVHSPIGLDIGAETPEEIAVSIVSELVAVRASQKKNPFVGTTTPDRKVSMM